MTPKVDFPDESTSIISPETDAFCQITLISIRTSIPLTLQAQRAAKPNHRLRRCYWETVTRKEKIVDSHRFKLSATFKHSAINSN
ncbi:hypothetical protein FHK02_2632 [Spirosoma sp. LMG 31448]|uniref:Uncharacterized protein n=1 Tax=Spirosoma utsteinense TaxID=2585773 RepID=A0ABR6W6X2_9BACT|nr:hypothetical protein [Spirosoma utsteinense]MBC3792337.1 hypothetical protein [Spirosoma utsteinense]